MSQVSLLLLNHTCGYIQAVQIEFTFNASELAGKELVAFEELYDVTNPDKPIKVAEHKDIEDKEQTLTGTSRQTILFLKTRTVNQQEIHRTITSKGRKEIRKSEKHCLYDNILIKLG